MSCRNLELGIRGWSSLGRGLVSRDIALWADALAIIGTVIAILLTLFTVFAVLDRVRKMRNGDFDIFDLVAILLVVAVLAGALFAMSQLVVS